MAPSHDKTKPLSYVQCTEQKRLNETRELGAPWKKWGPYLSERQWGTAGKTIARTGSLGDTSRTIKPDLARTAGARMGWLESRTISSNSVLRSDCGRSRSHSERAPVRVDKQRRKSRRRCKGILFLPRQYPNTLVHEVSVQVSAAGISVSRSDGNKRPPLSGRI